MTGYLMMAAVIGLLWAGFALALIVIAFVVDHLPDPFVERLDRHLSGDE